MSCALTVNAIKIPEDSERVIDADEEVFVLYSELQAKATLQSTSQSFRGLGYVDSRKDVLSLVIELRGGEVAEHTSEIEHQRKRKQDRQKTKTRTKRIPDKTIEVEIVQDTTALRSRKGDTGSVLWRASVDFAHLVLQQAHLNDTGSIFDFDRLKDAHIFELGAGTGVLSLLLSSLCRDYTATDIPELIPLMQKNIAMNCSSTSIVNSQVIQAKPFDWVELKNTPHRSRSTSFPNDNVIDLLLVVDCIYHPSLLLSLIESMDYLTTLNQTAVLVVTELRSEQVIREFLELWLLRPNWIIHRIPRLLAGPYAVWIGWKNI